jgi:D-xylose transport system permease protein
MAEAPSRSWRSMVASTELDTRLVGMVIALGAIWIAFNIRSGGDFLTARNLWNLSVQSTSIAIMATGMVLIIVSRNIDLSVGSLLGFLGYTMALVQTDG